MSTAIDILSNVCYSYGESSLINFVSFKLFWKEYKMKMIGYSFRELYKVLQIRLLMNEERKRAAEELEEEEKHYCLGEKLRLLLHYRWYVHLYFSSNFRFYISFHLFKEKKMKHWKVCGLTSNITHRQKSPLYSPLGEHGEWGWTLLFYIVVLFWRRMSC